MTDPSTGLPELPEDHFWRIRPLGLQRFQLELRKKMRWGSRRLDDRIGWESDISTSWLLGLAKNIMDSREADRIRYTSEHPYYGDYPPKRLGDTNE